MNPALLLLAALLMGLAVALAAWACRDWILGKFKRDQDWMRDTYLRFQPEPINASAYVLGYYSAYGVLLLMLLMMVPSWPVAAVVWIVSLFIPRFLIASLWKRRLKQIELQIPPTVATLSNNMRAGLTLVQAITRISEQAPEPIRMEFKIMANQYGYGADMETVIRNAKARLDLPNFTLFASALILNREMGGDISETLTRISKSLDKLREMKKTVEAHTSEGRTNIKVLLIAPVGIMLMMAFVMPKGVALLFTTPQGWAILGIAAALAGTGAYLANRITKSDVQESPPRMPHNVGIIMQLLAALLFGGAVMLLLMAAWFLVQRQRAIRSGATLTSMRRAEMRQAALSESPLFGVLLPLISSVAVTVNRLGLEPLRQYIHDPYVRAGYPWGLDDDEVVALAVLLSAAITLGLGFVVLALAGIFFIWIALVGIPLGFVALVVHLQNKAQERQVLIMRALPYALDLLVLMLRSGTSMRIALARLIEDYTRHPLGIELGQVVAEIDVGSHRADAFKKMSERLKIPDITSLVDAIVQSEELGWPLADTLERLADRINAERVLRAQTTAGAAGVYVMFPSALVLLAAVLLLFAPFIILFIKTGNIV